MSTQRAERAKCVSPFQVCLLAIAAGLPLCGCGHDRRGDTVTVACVGDVMLGRGVSRACKEHGDNYPFEAVGELLREPDITFGNLECPLAQGQVRFARVNALYAAPQMAQALAKAGFDVLGLANNHAVDCGRPGLLETIETLQAAGIAPVGVGSTAMQAQEGAVLTVKGRRFGFIAFSDFPKANFVHDPDRASILMLTEDNLRDVLPPLRSSCDHLVVSFHWGKEGSAETSSHERRLAHLAVQMGADLVVGHHAHVRGQIERLGGSLICYCLGNFVFDQDSYGGNEGLVVLCTFDRQGLIAHRAIPTRVVDCQARIDQF